MMAVFFGTTLFITATMHASEVTELPVSATLAAT
jgi:hypothetical protein